MNPIATRVSQELRARAGNSTNLLTPVAGPAWLAWRRLRGDLAIPAGGTSPLGMLGHVNAALELAEQIRSGELPEPSEVMVPLGSGGTTAGLALGFAIAGLRTTIVAARVVPRILGRKGRILRLAAATASYIERITGERLPRPDAALVRIDNGVYGGGYGWMLDRAADQARRVLEMTGLALDDTYSAKAFIAALESKSPGPRLFWSTFDGRWLTVSPGANDPDSRTVGAVVSRTPEES
jgi:D-cysteine desulfhydrase